MQFDYITDDDCTYLKYLDIDKHTKISHGTITDFVNSIQTKDRKIKLPKKTLYFIYKGKVYILYYNIPDGFMYNKCVIYYKKKFKCSDTFTQKPKLYALQLDRYFDIRDRDYFPKIFSGIYMEQLIRDLEGNGKSDDYIWWAVPYPFNDFYKRYSDSRRYNRTLRFNESIADDEYNAERGIQQAYPFCLYLLLNENFVETFNKLMLVIIDEFIDSGLPSFAHFFDKKNISIIDYIKIIDSIYIFLAILHKLLKGLKHKKVFDLIKLWQALYYSLFKIYKLLNITSDVYPEPVFDGLKYEEFDTYAALTLDMTPEEFINHIKRYYLQDIFIKIAENRGNHGLRFLISPINKETKRIKIVFFNSDKVKPEEPDTFFNPETIKHSNPIIIKSSDENRKCLVLVIPPHKNNITSRTGTEIYHTYYNFVVNAKEKLVRSWFVKCAETLAYCLDLTDNNPSTYHGHEYLVKAVKTCLVQKLKDGEYIYCSIHGSGVGWPHFRVENRIQKQDGSYEQGPYWDEAPPDAITFLIK